MTVFWQRFGRNRGAVFGLVVLVVVLLSACLASLIAPGSPWQMTGPPFSRPFGSAHPLGTDSLGRDVFAGIIHGARVSLLIGLVSTFAAVLVGVIVGALAGYFGGRLDDILMRLTEFVQTIPSVILAIVLVAIFRPSIA